MVAGEEEFVKRRIYLTLERGRDIALRNLFRKVFLAGGFEEAKTGGPPVRRTRIPVSEFGAAIRVGMREGGERMESDEVECLLANMIYKVSWLPTIKLILLPSYGLWEPQASMFAYAELIGLKPRLIDMCVLEFHERLYCTREGYRCA